MKHEKEENSEEYVTATTGAEFHEALNRGLAVELTWELGEDLHGVALRPLRTQGDNP